MGQGGGQRQPTSDTDLGGVDLLDRLKLEQELRDKQTVAPEQASKNQTNTLWDIAYSTPVVGNVLAAYDTPDHFADAYKHVQNGDIDAARKSMVQGELSALGAIVGWPVGGAADRAVSGASSRTNVFVPADKDATATARAMRDAGKTSREIWDNTKTLLTPAGDVRQEIPGFSMYIDKSKIQPRDRMKVGDAVDHPALFDRYPQLADTDLMWTSSTGKRGEPIARTNPTTGTFEMSAVPDRARGMAGKQAQFDKLFQYSIAQQEGFPAAVRHGYENVKDDLTDAISRSGNTMLDPQSAVSQAYRSHLVNALGDLKSRAKETNMHDAELRVGSSSAGNVDSRIVQSRALSPNTADRYPYSPGALSRRPGARIPQFENMLVLPPERAGADDLTRMIYNWYLYGAGKPRGPLAE